MIEPGVDFTMGGQKDITPTIMDILGGGWINNTLGNSLLATGGVRHALFVEGKQRCFIYKDRFLHDGRRGETLLYNLGDLMQPIEDEPALDMMRHYADALLTATYHLVHSRSVGLPEIAND